MVACSNMSQDFMSGCVFEIPNHRPCHARNFLHRHAPNVHHRPARNFRRRRAPKWLHPRLFPRLRRGKNIRAAGAENLPAPLARGKRSRRRRAEKIRAPEARRKFWRFATRDLPKMGPISGRKSARNGPKSGKNRSQNGPALARTRAEPGRGEISRFRAAASTPAITSGSERLTRFIGELSFQKRPQNLLSRRMEGANPWVPVSGYNIYSPNDRLGSGSGSAQRGARPKALWDPFCTLRFLRRARGNII